MIKSCKKKFNVLTGDKNVTHVIAKGLNFGFNLPSFDDTLKKIGIVITQVKPLHSSPLSPVNGVLTKEGIVSIAQTTELGVMPRVRGNQITFFNIPNLRLKMRKFCFNRSNARNTPINEIMFSAIKIMMKRVHVGGKRIRLKSLSNNIVTSIIV